MTEVHSQDIPPRRLDKAGALGPWPWHLGKEQVVLTDGALLSDSLVEGAAAWWDSARAPMLSGRPDDIPRWLAKALTRTEERVPGQQGFPGVAVLPVNECWRESGWDRSGLTEEAAHRGFWAEVLDLLAHDHALLRAVDWNETDLRRRNLYESVSVLLIDSLKSLVVVWDSRLLTKDVWCQKVSGCTARQLAWQRRETIVRAAQVAGVHAPKPRWGLSSLHVDEYLTSASTAREFGPVAGGHIAREDFVSKYPLLANGQLSSATDVLWSWGQLDSDGAPSLGKIPAYSDGLYFPVTISVSQEER